MSKADRGLFRLNEEDAAKVRARAASGDPFAGGPDPYITQHLLRQVEIDEREALLIIDNLRFRWRAAQKEGAVSLPRSVGSPDHRALAVTGGVILEDVASRAPLTERWTEALLEFVTDDVPGEWFDRAVTTLAENPTLPPTSRPALAAAARRSDLSGYRPHMMGPDYAVLLRRVPHALVRHPAPMTDEFLGVLLAGDVDDELLDLLLHRPELTESQRAAIINHAGQ